MSSEASKPTPVPCYFRQGILYHVTADLFDVNYEAPRAELVTCLHTRAIEGRDSYLSLTFKIQGEPNGESRIDGSGL